jgi:hypothetical protein
MVIMLLLLPSYSFLVYELKGFGFASGNQQINRECMLLLQHSAQH